MTINTVRSSDVRPTDKPKPRWWLLLFVVDVDVFVCFFVVVSDDWVFLFFDVFRSWLTVVVDVDVAVLVEVLLSDFVLV